MHLQLKLFKADKGQEMIFKANENVASAKTFCFEYATEITDLI